MKYIIFIIIAIWIFTAIPSFLVPVVAVISGLLLGLMFIRGKNNASGSTTKICKNCKYYKTDPFTGSGYGCSKKPFHTAWSHDSCNNYEA